MNLDDLKDRLASEANATWDRLQESTLFNKIRDRYENLTPTTQKITLIGLGVVILFGVFSIPYSHYSLSQDYVGEFETRRNTIRELLKVSRDSKDIPRFNDNVTTSALQNRVDAQLKDSNLLPEQIRETRVIANVSKIVPKTLGDDVLIVSLAKINLTQIIDLGYSFQSFGDNVKLKDIEINSNREDSRYFDVIYKLIALNAPLNIDVDFDQPIEKDNSKSKSKKKFEEEQ